MNQRAKFVNLRDDYSISVPMEFRFLVLSRQETRELPLTSVRLLLGLLYAFIKLGQSYFSTCGALCSDAIMVDSLNTLRGGLPFAHGSASNFAALDSNATGINNDVSHGELTERSVVLECNKEDMGVNQSFKQSDCIRFHFTKQCMISISARLKTQSRLKIAITRYLPNG